VIVCGLEPIHKEDGSLKCYSDTFLNNARTYIKDNPGHNVSIIDCRNLTEEAKPMSTVIGRIRELSKATPIDLLIYSGHSSTSKLLVFYKTRQELSEPERFWTRDSKWTNIQFSDIAEIWLWGCRTGGNYEVDPQAIAQKIADSSRVPVKGYTCRTSQKMIDGKYYQLPENSSYTFLTFLPS
jgi:hypothetical protein